MASILMVVQRLGVALWQPSGRYGQGGGLLGRHQYPRRTSGPSLRGVAGRRVVDTDHYGVALSSASFHRPYSLTTRYANVRNSMVTSSTRAGLRVESWEAQISAVAALDEPTRRQLYEYVVRQPEPVSRDEAAAAVGLPRTTAAFHLDRLVEEDLLDVSYQRRNGRTGPGAGRPAKLYRRSPHQVAVSLPQRRYDLAGQLLSSALEHAERSGNSPRAILDQRAYQLGKELGETARDAAGGHDTRDTALRILEEYGFQPRIEGDDVVLRNCPFYILAQHHTELVCGMNLSLFEGLLEGLATTGLTGHLRPTAPHCCVRLEPAVSE